ncbi:hypothetical protein RJ641_024607, partial [Dillenia turbinata]
NGVYGCGLYVVPDDSSIESMKSLVIDSATIKLAVLCHIIRGKSELILAGSKECYPSFEELDLRVDNILAPKKHIVCSQMVTYFLPEYVINLRTPPRLEGFKGTWENNDAISNTVLCT